MKVKAFPMGYIETNCYVVSDDNGTCAIIDCDGNPERLYSYVAENNLKPTHILLTHGHFDHIGSVEEVKAKYGCQVYGGREEMPVFTNPRINESAFSSNPIALYPDVQVSEGDVIQVGDLRFQVLLTPGHTIGCLCFTCQDSMFSGDTLFQGSCGRTDLPTGDWASITQSLRRLANLPGDYTVYPGHGPATTLSYERMYNPYMPRN